MNTRFLDGPAAGATLELKRAPMLLRVVIGRGGKVDALDQIHDQPKEHERVSVYRRQGPASKLTEEFVGFICGRGRGCLGVGDRSTVIARYRVHEVQPSDEIARDNAAWSRWAMSQAANLKEATRE